jgi:hypothetical protein
MLVSIQGGRLMADWQKIKTEYITTDISLRKLAEKYGIRYATVQDRSKKEEWITLRDQHRTSTVSKSISKISNRQADKLARIEGITDKLLMKLEQAVEELDLEIIKRKTKVEGEGLEVTTETMEAREGGIVDRAGLRHLTAALKDLKEIQMIKSELDRREQEARIAKLQKEAEGEDDDGEIQVVITGRAKEYAK